MAQVTLLDKHIRDYAIDNLEYGNGCRLWFIDSLAVMPPKLRLYVASQFGVPLPKSLLRLITKHVNKHP